MMKSKLVLITGRLHTFNIWFWMNFSDIFIERVSRFWQVIGLMMGASVSSFIWWSFEGKYRTQADSIRSLVQTIDFRILVPTGSSAEQSYINRLHLNKLS